MPFEKGTSGNPGGRARLVLADGRTLTDVAREHTVTAVECLVEIVEDNEAPHAARVSSAVALLDRGWGRPRQDMLLATTEAKPLSEIEKAARLAAIFSEIDRHVDE